MDMRKVFNDTEQIPPHLLAKVESSRLKVDLCEECVNLNEQFTDNYRKLEKAEMELGSCLKLIHTRFLDNSETGNPPKNLLPLVNVEPHLKLNSGGEMEILEVLREEAFQKSHRKLRAVMPRLKFCNLTKKDVRRKQLKFKADINVSRKHQNTSLPFTSTGDLSKSRLEASEVKMELETSDAYSASDDGGGNCPSEDLNTYYEALSDDGEHAVLNADAHVNNTKTKPETTTFLGVVTKMHDTRRVKAGIPESILVPETGKHKCPTCSMEFSTKLGCQRHYESVHLKVRFKCVTCEKQFTDRSACKRHQKSVHAGVRYACPVCNKIFTQTGDVRKHQRTTNCGKKMDLVSTPKHT